MSATLVLLAALLTGMSPAAPASAQTQPPEPAPAQEWSAGEGTTVVLVEDHRAPLVHVTLDFAAGTWSPWFIEEHVEEAFEIQLYDSAGTLRRREDGLGIVLSLRAGDLSSTLAFSCLKSDLKAALALAGDVLTNRDVDRRELKRLNQARLIEWKGSLKDPNFRLAQAVAALLFSEGDPRRRPYEEPSPISTDVPGLTAARDRLIGLPGRIIGFAGDLTRPEAESLAAGLLPPVVDASRLELAPRVGPLTDPAARPREHVVKLPRLTQVYLGCGRDSLRYADPDYSAAMIADKVLGGSFYSRLSVALRHEGGETYAAIAISTGGVHQGIAAMYTFTRAENAAVAEKKVQGVLRRFHNEGITESERADAAGNIIGTLAFERQTPAQLLGERLRELRAGLPAGSREQLARRAAALKLDDVNAFIERFYDPAAYTTVKVAPE